MTTTLDKRFYAYRDDLADIRLKEKVSAQNYCQPTEYSIVAPFTDLKQSPAMAAKTDKQLLMGEIVDVFEIKNGWCWVQSQRDDYVGYCLHSAIGEKYHANQRIHTLRSPVFAEADLKSEILSFLPLNAEILTLSTSIKEKASEKFVPLKLNGINRQEKNGWIYHKHIMPVDRYSLSFLTAAHMYLHAPYVWGGNSDLGIDCSGLIQMAARACGYDIPRDTGPQEAFFTEDVPFHEKQAGDLLFWPGHVAIYLGDEQALHANASEMKTSIHDFQYLCDYIEKEEGVALRSIKRPAFNAIL